MPDINQGIEEFKAAKNALLLDVRTREEYAEGHIPGSISIPLDEIAGSRQLPEDKAKELYVYCLSGGRSSQAVQLLKRQGYIEARNIGGINGYKGRLER